MGLLSGAAHGSVSEAARAARARELLALSGRRQAAFRVERPTGFAPVETRYASLAAAGDWRRPAGALAVAKFLLDSIADGADRSVLSWPRRTCDGAVAAAVALREARARGILSHATVAVWPWRASSGASHGSMAPTRSILVHPDDLAAVGRRIATAVHDGAAWCGDGLAHMDAARVEIRAGDLTKDPSRAGDAARVPTLREATVAFSADPRTGAFADDGEQVMRRVLRFTSAGARARSQRDLIGEAVARAGAAGAAPHALFGLPLGSERALRAALSGGRFARGGPDVVLANVHSGVLSIHRDAWKGGLEVLVKALAAAPGRRPPLVLFSDDPHALRQAEAIVRAENPRLRRALPARHGIYAPEHRPIAELAPPPEGGVPRYDADIKDAGLAPMRRAMLGIGAALRDAGDREGARAARNALDCLHLAASMPLGLRAAAAAADTLWDGDTDEERGAAALFHPRHGIRRLAAVCLRAGVAVNEAVDVVRAAEARLDLWAEATPVSARLAGLLAEPGWNAPSTVVSFPDPRIALLFGAASTPGAVLAAATCHLELPGVIGPGRVIVVAPTPEAVHALLAAAATPERVLVLGDCAGIGLVSALLRSLSGLKGFGVLGERARLLRERLAAGGGDASLDEREASYRMAPLPDEGGVLDFTRGGDAFHGDVAVIRTRRREIRFRAGAKVPVYTPDEVRPFELREARRIERGDPIPVFDEEVRNRLRRAMQASSRTHATIAGYHAFIADKREGLPYADPTACARHVSRLMNAPGEVHNVRRWLLAGDPRRTAAERAKPEAPRDWTRFASFMAALGADEGCARTYWRTMVLPTRSYSVQEGAIFHDILARFLVDPEGSAHLARGESAEGLLDRVRDAVDTVISVEVTKGDKH